MQWEQGHGDKKAGAPRGHQGREAALRQEGRGQSRKCPFRPCEQGLPLPPNEVEDMGRPGPCVASVDVSSVRSTAHFHLA